MAPNQYISIASRWKAGRVRSRVVAAGDEAAVLPAGGCVHPVPPTLTLTEATKKRLCQVHEQQLCAGFASCGQDLRSSFERRARVRPRRALLVTPTGTADIGCVQSLTTLQVARILQKEAPGDWVIACDGCPLPCNDVPLRDVVPCWTAEPVRLNAELRRAPQPSPASRVASLGTTLRHIEMLAADPGASASEVEHAARAARRTRKRLQEASEACASDRRARLSR